ncbi:MAG: LamG domain-containing protein, partial [Phycisphaerae bacterium]
EASAAGGDLETALDALNRLREAFALEGTRSFALEMELLTKVWRQARKPRQYAEVAWRFAALADRATAARHWPTARAAMKNLYTTARAAREVDLLSNARPLNEYLKSVQRLQLSAARAESRLTERPNDLTAHQTRGEYLAFVQGEWDQGLKHLTQGSDATLAAIARADLTQPADPNAQLRLADAYLKEAAGQQRALATGGLARRAVEWYSRAIPHLDADAKASAGKQLDKAKQILAAAVPAIGSPVPRGAVLHLSFDRSSLKQVKGVTVLGDKAQPKRLGNPHDVTLKDGVRGQAGAFNGRSSAVVFRPAAGPLNNTTDLSIACWVRTSNAGGWIVGQRQKGPVDGEYLLGIDGEGRPHYWDYNSGYGIRATASKAVTDGKWHHVVFVRKGTEYGWYVDGKPAGAGKGTSRVIVNLQLGVGYDHRDQGGFYNGLLDELLLYSRVLSREEVKQLHRMGNP